MITSFKMRCDIYAQHLFRRPTFQSHQMPAQTCLRSQRATWSQCPLGSTLWLRNYFISLLLYLISQAEQNILSFSLETSPITDSDTAKRTVFQRSYSVVASEYDKQHSPSPARVKAVPRRRVHSGDAGNQKWLQKTRTRMNTMYHIYLTPTLPVTQRWDRHSYDTPPQSCPDWSRRMAPSVRGRGTSSGLSWLLLFSTMIWRVSKWPWGMHWGNLLAECLPWRYTCNIHFHIAISNAVTAASKLPRSSP